MSIRRDLLLPMAMLAIAAAIYIAAFEKLASGL